MAIYNIFDLSEKESSKLESEEAQKTIEKIELAEAKLGFHQEKSQVKDRFFSSLAARLFFVLLLIADVGFGLYTIVLLSLYLALNLMTGFKVSALRRLLAKSFLNIKRFLICFLALFVATMSPALGIMFACTYFLMYDKEGIEEIVPTSLQEQFKEFFKA